MCVWCRGAPLGDLSEPSCGLWEAAIKFHWLSDHLADLWDESLAGLDDRAALDFLDGLLYGYHRDVAIEDHRTNEQIKRDSERFRKFNFLTNWGEQFDGCKAFIVCPPAGPVRILSRHLPESLNCVAEVTREGFVSAAQGFVGWFNEEQARLLSSPQ
jgi:hypothetical protein